MPRYTIHRKDENHDTLVEIAEQFGGYFIVAPPLDGWLYSTRINLGGWLPVEIKRADREGHKNEYTPKQRKFIEACKLIEAPYRTWRSADDVKADLNQRWGQR